jgi:hypothetical protein
MKHTKYLFAGLIVGLCALVPALADVPIDPGGVGSRQIELDHDPDTGNYFAVVRWVDSQFEAWALYISTDQGATWSSNVSLTTTGEWLDVDLAVAGDYVYVGYTRGGDQARIARFFTTDGSLDTVYSFRTLIDVSPANVVDIALASDKDGPDNEIYYALIASDGSLRFFFDSSADGTTFAELSPGISDAVSGLDLTYNAGSPDHLLLFSYWQDPSILRIWRSFPWEGVYNVGWSAPRLQSRISAYDDRAIVCFENPGLNGLGIVSFTTYDAGDSWTFSSLDSPTPGEGDYTGCDVTARAGGEFAVTYMHEEGSFDPVYLRRHTRGESGPWEERVLINETDVTMASIFRTSLNWFPPGHYGIAYIEDSMGTPYFDRFALLFFADDFESGDTSAWSNTVP